MKNKIKSLASACALTMMVLPALVSAAPAFQAPTGTGLPEGSITGIITNVMNWLLMLVGIIGVIGFAISGILYMTAAGDEGRLGSAKSAMTFSIIGVIVAIIGVVVIKAAQGLLGGTNSSF
ncbi:MAG: hypothetical protein UT50_C0017G0017 [Candidatus Moranbacteria bacterium GW2011_GWA2_39_41]|nr:MAG: hypothetical protein UT50_C0017G0017 [Candidatus Moranbacteria bacterium GW2011_GWA2_39_41]